MENSGVEFGVEWPDAKCDCLYCGNSMTVVVNCVFTTKKYVYCRVCEASGPHKDTPEDAIAAWNARARNGVPVGYVAVYPDGTPYTNHLFNDDNDPQLSPSANVRLVPVYTHPAPAVDAGEVERLVDALKVAREFVVEQLEYEKKNCRQSDSELTGKYLEQIDAALIEHVTGKGK